MGSHFQSAVGREDEQVSSPFFYIRSTDKMRPSAVIHNNVSHYRFNVIPILADILSDSVKEKVTRIILAVFRVSWNITEQANYII